MSYFVIPPGLYTIVTFPFLFSVMFGDVCHGIILLSFAGWMVWVEKDHMDKRSRNEIWNIFFGGVCSLVNSFNNKKEASVMINNYCPLNSFYKFAS